MGYESKPYDGLHRIAAALALGEKVWVHEYNDRPISEVTLEWFQNNGFTQEDQIRILRAYTDTYEGKCGIFLLYAPVENLWDYMEKQIGNFFTVVGKIDYDFSANYIAFENIMRQVYYDWNQYSEWLTRKMDVLVTSPLKYRIILVSDEEKSLDRGDFYEAIKELKMNLRSHLFMDVDHRIPVIIHASDSRKEFFHLRDLFLSANNIKWLKNNMRQYYRCWFLDQIEQIRTWGRDNHIDMQKICVVGSAVMELYGIRDAHNFNIIISEVATRKIESMPDTIEIFYGDYCLDEENYTIPNNVVVEDDNYHTVFADLKFCNLDFIYRYKLARKAKKDIVDTAKIKSWFDFTAHFDNKDGLQKQIKRELYKRGVLL